MFFSVVNQELLLKTFLIGKMLQSETKYSMFIRFLT